VKRGGRSEEWKKNKKKPSITTGLLLSFKLQ
jgi:hypothetical protein